MRWACRAQQKPDAGQPLHERLVRRADKQFTACRERLEGPDKPASRWAALAVITVSILYVIAHLILRFCLGG